MPWPIPTAKAIAAKIAGSLEVALLRIRPGADPADVSRAVRSAYGVFSQIGRAFSLELREVHDHLAWWGRQYFPDTAEEEFIFRHAGIWGVEQRGATKAVGSILIEGVAGTPLPSLLQFSASNAVIYQTTAATAIGAGGTVTVAAAAVAAGTAGNLESGVQVTVVTPFPEISKATSAAAFVGGADEATPAEIQASTLERIRQPPHGGAAFDYPTWVAQVASIKAVGVIEDWIGRGSVGIVVLMKNDDGTARVPSSAEIDVIQEHLGGVGSQTGTRPVTARVIVVPGVLRTLAITVRLRPDTVITRAAVTDAWQRFVATIGDEEDTQNASPIGAVIEPSRISEAISAAAGEYAHDLDLPAARFTLERTEYPVAGPITFEDA
ncbi:Baseplate J family protein [Rhizobium sophoriradicis]|uniref:baseplate J/gp47 family protein n=1 Tax=Rhizobium TaxID=379 RepID=UPI0001905F8C|nr:MULTISPECIES: baseplate J/gp47 family protein [Rhizobium]ARQ59178.1 phage baseplate assembly J-like protein [Rhizobium sp. Kim5]RSB91764.1 Baseplate J family protein [Rhizobium sophoriradicis]